MAKKKRTDDASETTSALAVFVDRLEGNLAVLVTGDDDKVSFNLPRKYLPDDVREGDYLKLSFQTDPEKTEALRAQVVQLQEELLSASDQDQMNIKL